MKKLLVIIVLLALNVFSQEVIKTVRVIKDVYGQDSLVITTYTTINPSYAITEEITIKEGESYQNWTTSGVYTRKLKTVAGCDSIVTTNLNVEFKK
jgi:hypothetical protein